MCMWDQPPHKWDVCLFNITLLLVGLLATNDSLSYLIKKILRIFLIDLIHMSRIHDYMLG